MFEDSFVAARAGASGAARRRWITAGSLTLQGCLACGLLLSPMLDPARLVARTSPPVVFVPVQPLPPPKPVARQRIESTSAVSQPPSARALSAPPRIPHGISAEDPGPLPLVAMAPFSGGDGMSASGVPAALGEGAPGVRVRVAAPGAGPKKPVRVSAGVTAGLLLEPIRPAYPAIARAAHVSGEVQVAATISRDGRIEDLHVVSGPEILRSAALDAIRQARYRPFLLNGEPTAVETTITVNFRMGG